MTDITEQYRKIFYYHGFGFRYVRAITDENDVIKGGSLYVFGKQILTIAISNTEWVGEDGTTYKCKLEDRVLFIKKLAIGFLPYMD